MKNKKVVLWIILIIPIVSIILSLSLGKNSISFSQMLNIFLGKIFNLNLGNEISNLQIAIIWDIRLPRILLSFLIGGMLSISGCIFQSVLRNPLASSYTLGVSSGASLGVGLLIVFGFNSLKNFSYAFVGFSFSILTVLFVLFLCKRIDKRLNNNSVILVGMVISLFLDSLLNLITSMKKESLSSILIWKMGSFSSRGWGYLIFIIPIFVISFFCVMFFVKELDILTFGDEMGNSVGVNVKNVKFKLLILSSVLTGVSISSSGIIGFIDLITPQICRKIFGGNHKIIIPLSMILGGSFMIWFDFVARNIVYPSELPLSTINALIGTPIFCYVLFRRTVR